jgi:hypothetical protein
MHPMRTLLLLLLANTTAVALPILTLPESASVFATAPNNTLLIPFSITPDATNYVVINSVQGSVTRSPGEIYSILDILSNFVSNNAYALAPGGPAWTDSFTPNLAGTTAGAIGSIAFPANATPGPATGNLIISYELFDLDPFVDSAATSLGNNTLTTLFTVNIEAPTAIPEPGTFAIMGLSLLVFSISRHSAAKATSHRHAAQHPPESR